MNNRRTRLTVTVTAILLLIGARDARGSADEAGGKVDFRRDVAPILTSRCVGCHGPAERKGGYRLDRRAPAIAGGDSGRAITTGSRNESELFRRLVSTDPGERMPRKGPVLTPAEIETIGAWIDSGAEWPSELRLADDNAAPTHWSFRPIRTPEPPSVRDESWARHPIDRFVLRRLEAEGLRPAPEADRYTLIRRASLDLTGLPPAPDEVAAFIGDTQADAYERLVDRLLASPAYGERWARVWLDLARYADSKGYGSDPLRSIWRYRDWVIDAFNRNIPFNEFTTEQLAGDLLPNATVDQILATAFHRNTLANDEGGTDDEEFRVIAVKDRVSTTAQVWMGLTMGCAQCHSHKFDPITQREYYEFYAFFNNTADSDKGDERPRIKTPTEAQQRELAALERELERLRLAPRSGAERNAALERWERERELDEKSWVPLAFERLTADRGVAVDAREDGELVVGAAPKESALGAVSYDLRVNLDTRDISGFRLDVFPSSSGSEPPEGDPTVALPFIVHRFGASYRPAGGGALRGRFVRIELPGNSRMLSLAEVEVFSGAENIARRGKARQSSTDFGGPAELAIDGNTNGNYSEAMSTTHTKLESDPWWEVDLGEVRDLGRIAVWNRTDNRLQSRLDGFRVLILDEDRTPVWQSREDKAPATSVAFAPDGARSIALTAPSANSEAAKWSIANAVRDDASEDSGWAGDATSTRRFVAVFPVSEPLPAGDSELAISLRLSAPGGGSLPRVRVSVLRGRTPVPVAPVAASKLLAISPSERTAADREALGEALRLVLRRFLRVDGKMAPIRTRITELERNAPRTPVLNELEGKKRRTTRVMTRGNFLTPGDEVSAAVPAAFGTLPSDAPANRLGVARWLLSSDNPLTARVTVNRFWARIFGTGLVRTEEDFGKQGEAPSHPELLDWLASDFRTDWDMKRFVRSIVLSSTYRQSSRASKELRTRDPANRLLARGPSGRLEAEMVRDQALAIAGLLSRKIGGPSVYPPQPPGLWRAAFNGDRKWPTSTGEDRYRRGLYTFWRRTVPYPSMATFDAPSREVCTLRRTPTNTPLQAFVTLNDPGFVEAAQALGRRILREGGESTHDRAAFALRLALARPPSGEQIATLAGLFESERKHYETHVDAAEAIATDPLGALPSGVDVHDAAAWTVVANVVLNLDAVLTKR